MKRLSHLMISPRSQVGAFDSTGAQVGDLQEPMAFDETWQDRLRLAEHLGYSVDGCIYT